uniref:Protein kinase domain-containing protein n=1 Tax=Proboscia inermis TaxID=420281 RepID=A0A7S0C561_9STRA|mmetsp:Transcript_2558/g.2600  ORF Transcript_2558/g.2600 Transcript_2558/m.2600 type:complete len:306 (+) Transcript_2558:76-993(+)
MKLSPISANPGDSFTNDTTVRDTIAAEDCRDVVHNMLTGKLPLDEDVLASFAADEVEDLCRNSALISEDAEGRIARFNKKEIIVGHTLGQGGYSTVCEISAVNLLRSKSEKSGADQFGTALRKANSSKKCFKTLDTIGQNGEKNQLTSMGKELQNSDFGWDECDMMDQIHDRNLIAKHCIREGKARYAIKMLHSSYSTNKKQHFNGIIDLAVETRFLAYIRHPNVVRMRAMSMGDPYKSGFFIVMDRLYDTLSTRIPIWAAEHKKNKGLLRKWRGGVMANRLLWSRRLVVILDIASVLKYLHSMK